MLALALIATVAAVVSVGWPGPTRPAATLDPGRAAQPARIADRPPGGDPARITTIPDVRIGTTIAASNAYDSAGGAEMRDAEGNLLTIEPRSALAIFEGPKLVAGEAWFRVYVLPNDSWGPTDYFAWVPLHAPGGVEAITVQDPPACPNGPGILALGVLDPFTRARCVGAASFGFQGWTWIRSLPTWYRITPEWLGEQNGAIDSTISLHENRRGRLNAGPGAIPFLDVQLPPGLERPPFEFRIDVTAHVADPQSAACRRGRDQFAMVPDDPPQNGPMWCATRVVVEQWTPLLGPEERVIDRAAPQLHRHPQAGPNFGCAGVGMGPLAFHVDATQLDPVWLEAIGFPESRIIPSFAPGFRTAFGPELVIVDETGRVVARNGTPVDPDGQLAGHAICPTGTVVFFD